MMDVPEIINTTKKGNASSKKYIRYLQGFQFDKKKLRERSHKQYYNIDTDEDNDNNDDDSINASEYYAYERIPKRKFTYKKRMRVDKESFSHKPYIIRIPLDRLVDDNNEQLCSENEIKNTTENNDDYDNNSLFDSKQDNISIQNEVHASEKINSINNYSSNDDNDSTIYRNNNYVLKQNISKEINTFTKLKKQNISLNEIFKQFTYINCDLRYFNLNYLIQRIGYFDVILIDPPWRFKQKSTFNTLSNNDIINIKVECLSEKGFCFLWVTPSFIKTGYYCLNKWGYDVIDQIIWVKQQNNTLYISKEKGHCFFQSFAMCLVGYKCPNGKHVDYKSKVSSNVIISEIESTSKKPDELYKIIEQMLPGSKKIELFAKNHNLREGWLSLGNQLGIKYEQNDNVILCNNCQKEIKIGMKRYKSKLKDKYDLCETCYNTFYTNKTNIVNSHLHLDFFDLNNNNISNDIYHDYIICNKCQSEPIYGIRFNCRSCVHFNLCETCFDNEISLTNTQHKEHEFLCFEVPECTKELIVHLGCRCRVCYMKPVIGPCFECLECKDVFYCQNCYFNAGNENDGHFGRNAKHTLKLRLKEKIQMNKNVKCNGCHKAAINERYKCDQCFEYNLCGECYDKRYEINMNGHSHKLYHSFSCFYM